MPTILDSLFQKVVDTTSSPIGMEGGGGGEPQSGGTFQYKKIIWPNGINSGCFRLHISQNVATSMPVSQASIVVITCRLSAWLGKLEPFTGHAHPWTPDRPVNEASDR